MTPLVSILIPAYNVERYLRETVRSALAQTWPNKEIIIVNDGSRDGTLAIARSFASAQVKVIDQENRGQSASENVAFRNCQGDLIDFLDADDLMEPEKVEKQVARLSRDGIDCVASGRWARFYETPGDWSFVSEPFWTDMNPIDWLVSAWERHSMMHGAAWLIPRAIAEKAGPWDESLSLINDFDYFPRVLLCCRQVLFCPDSVTYYRSAMPNSLSQQRSATAWDSALRSLESSTALLLRWEDSPRTRRACLRQFEEFIFAAFPDVPQLIRRAEEHVSRLGGPLFQPEGGPLFQLFSGILGWRLARRLQVWRLRHLPPKRRRSPVNGRRGG